MDVGETWRDQLVTWLDDNPSAVPLPTLRTSQQWLAWMRAEGFIEEIESPYHYYPDWPYHYRPGD